MGRRCFALSQSEEGPRRGAGRYLPVLLSLVSTLATSINVVRANRTSQRCPYGYTYRWDRHLNTQSMPSTHTGLPQPPVRGVTFLQRVEAKQPAYRARDARISLPHPGVSRWPVAECRFVILSCLHPRGRSWWHAHPCRHRRRIMPGDSHERALYSSQRRGKLPVATAVSVWQRGRGITTTARDTRRHQFDFDQGCDRHRFNRIAGQGDSGWEREWSRREYQIYRDRYWGIYLEKMIMEIHIASCRCAVDEQLRRTLWRHGDLARARSLCWLTYQGHTVFSSLCRLIYRGHTVFSNGVLCVLIVSGVSLHGRDNFICSDFF